MKQQVNSDCKSAYCHLRHIHRIRRYLTTQAVKYLTQSLVISQLDYCNVLYQSLPKHALLMFQRAQNAAARVITKTPRRHHIAPILMELHWLPIERRCQYKILLYTFKSLHGMAPNYISNMLQWYQPTCHLRSENYSSLVPPQISTVTYGNRTFPSQAALLWNALPLHLWNTSSII